MNKLIHRGFLKHAQRNMLSVIIFIFYLLAVSSQVKTYPHIPLKGLFEVLKIDDIGFAHALLHSKWIENMYQYGPGKPHRQIEVRNRLQWKIDNKNDAIANLVRLFWFRRSEEHQLLSSKFGLLANISCAKLGIVFGELINYVYRGCPQGLEDILIKEFLEYDEQYKRELVAYLREVNDQEYKLNDKKFGLVEKIKNAEKEEIKRLHVDYRMAELNGEIKKASKACKVDKNLVFKDEKKKIEDKFDRAGYLKALKEAKQGVFEGVTKETQDEYRTMQADVKKTDVAIARIIKKKREAIKKELFDPIRQALCLCKTGEKYIPRTTEGILWALFFHKLEDLSSLDKKIAAINDCINQIDGEFKQDNVVLQDRYTKIDFYSFGQDLKHLDGNKQVDIILQNYDIGLHYCISLTLGGTFPPVISQGSYGYEYELGKISCSEPNCHETAILDVLSILWYNEDKEAFDDSLFSEHVIKNGEGLKRLREALKYSYLADKKKIKAEEYTCEYKNKKFTSLAKLKSLGKISQEEIEALDISQVPVSYINRSEIKQEFFNIVSGIPGVLYCSKVSELKKQGKIFELDSDIRNVIKICNYFYGTNVATVAELGHESCGISTEEREITFNQVSQDFAPNKIKMSMRSDIGCFDMKMHINGNHTYLAVSNRKKKSCDFFKEDFAKILLSKKPENCLRHLSIFTFFTSEKMLGNKRIDFDVPTLHLLYYTLLLGKSEIKRDILKDILLKYPNEYDKFKFFVHNLIEKYPNGDQWFFKPLCWYIFESGKHKQDNFLQEYVMRYREHLPKILFEIEQEKGLMHLPQKLGGDINEKNKDSKTVLMLAIQKYCMKIAQLLLQQLEIDVNADTGYRRKTALMMAANYGHAEIVKLLLENPKIDNINKKSRFSGTALTMAVRRGYIEIVKLLLEHPKIDVNARDDGEIVLMIAAKNGHTEIVKLLFEQPKIDINAKYRGDTALEMAVKNGHIEIVKLLLKQPKIDVNATSGFYKEVLRMATKNDYIEIVELLPEIDIKIALVIVAVEKGYVEIVKQLLKKLEIDINEKEKYVEKTLLMMAAEKGQVEIVKLLLQQSGVDCNAKRKREDDQDTALMIAVKNEKVEIVKLLLQQPGIDLNVKEVIKNEDTKIETTLLIWAIQNKHEEIVNFLLEQPAIKEDISLVVAAWYGYKEIVELLIEQKKIDVNTRWNYGITALIAAAKKGHREIVELLLEQDGININAKGSCDETALMKALRNDNIEIVKLLLKQSGIDLSARSYLDARTTALRVVIEKDNIEILKLILEHSQININAQYYDCQKTVLMLAIEKSNIEIVRLLLKYLGIDLNIKTKYSKETALMIAAKKGDMHIVKLLLDQPRIDINALGYFKETALMKATNEGHIDIVALLLRHPDIDINANKYVKDGWEVIKGDRCTTHRPKMIPILIWAVKKKSEEIVKLLLAREEIDFDAKNEALLWAIKNEHINIASMIVQHLLIEKNIKDINWGKILEEAKKILEKDTKNKNEIQEIVTCIENKILQVKKLKK